MTPTPDAHHLIAHALAVLGLTPHVQLLHPDPDGQTPFTLPGGLQGHVTPDEVTALHADTLPLPDRRAILTRLLGCTLATHVLQWVSAPLTFEIHADGAMTLTGERAVIAWRGLARNPEAGVNTQHPLLRHLLLPLPSAVGLSGGRLILEDGRRLHAMSALACHHRSCVYVSRAALDATGMDHPFPYGTWLDPWAVPAEQVQVLMHALHRESGDTLPDPRAPL